MVFCIAVGANTHGLTPSKEIDFPEASGNVSHSQARLIIRYTMTLAIQNFKASRGVLKPGEGKETRSHISECLMAAKHLSLKDPATNKKGEEPKS